MHYKRKRPKTSGKAHYSNRVGTGRFAHYHSAWMCWWPRWHDIVFHRRPARRATKHMLDQLRNGADPDALAWPRDKRPHVYYW